MKSLDPSLKKLARILSSPTILFWIVPLLMALLVLGTVAQKNIGLYAAQEKYFGSFFTMLGPVPIPAGLTIMGIFFINLLCKFLFKSDWSWEKSGTILSHFGVLLLVFGGLMTTLTAKEGFLLIPQGEQASVLEDYHERNLAILKNDRIILTVPHTELKDGLEVKRTDLPFDLVVSKYCFNCGISLRPETEQDDWRPPAQFMMLNKVPADPQDEKNMSGLEFKLHFKSGDQNDLNGNYLTFDGFPKPPTYTIGNDTYKIVMERAKRPLPFAIRLDNFKRDLHPGTMMAKAFTSQVTVMDQENNIQFPATIEMNEPLRYRGMTFYQSSFDLSGETPYTVLAVVENQGRIFPYIASCVIALGLMIHLVIRLKQTARRKRESR